MGIQNELFLSIFLRNFQDNDSNCGLSKNLGIQLELIVFHLYLEFEVIKCRGGFSLDELKKSLKLDSCPQTVPIDVFPLNTRRRINNRKMVEKDLTPSQTSGFPCSHWTTWSDRPSTIPNRSRNDCRPCACIHRPVRWACGTEGRVWCGCEW